METINKLPEKDFVIGAKEIAKAAGNGRVNKLIVARNCPEELIKKVSVSDVKMFDGNQDELGTRIGKPFPVAMIGYEE
jgi:large subunit ribosomal protein L30e